MTEFEANLRRLRGEIHDFAARMRKAEVAATILEQTLMQIPSRFVPGTMGGMGCVTAFPFEAVCIPFAMPFSIGKAAFGVLTWNGASETDTAGYWTGCVLYSRPAVGACTARTIPLFCKLVPVSPLSAGSNFSVQWITSVGTCPDSGKTCSDLASVTNTNTTNIGLHTPVTGVYGNGTASFGSTDGIPAGQPADFWINNNYFFLDIAYWLPETIDFVDSMYGAVSLVWDGTVWTGCIPGIAYPGFSTCGAATIAIHYDIGTDGSLTIRWKATSGCPSTSTCATATTASDTVDPLSYTGMGGPYVYEYPGGAATMQKLYRDTLTDFTVSIP